jgi:hypothetical protein
MPPVAIPSCVESPRMKYSYATPQGLCYGVGGQSKTLLDDLRSTLPLALTSIYSRKYCLVTPRARVSQSNMNSSKPVAIAKKHHTDNLPKTSPVLVSFLVLVIWLVTSNTKCTKQRTCRSWPPRHTSRHELPTEGPPPPYSTSPAEALPPPKHGTAPPSEPASHRAAPNTPPPRPRRQPRRAYRQQYGTFGTDNDEARTDIRMPRMTVHADGGVIMPGMRQKSRA